MKVIVSFSGGKDSQACLIQACKEFGADKDTIGLVLTMTQNPQWEPIFGAFGIAYNSNAMLEDGTVTTYMKHPHYLDAINYLRTKYDYIILDTPPIGLVSDTLELGRTADTTIFVARADYSIKANFSLINTINKDKKMKKINLVLNGIDLKKRKYGYYYGYGKYSSYSHRGKYGYYGKYSHYGHYGVYGSYRYSSGTESNE